jgi:N6-L-threonylcarbamoyladenine synthase
MKYKNILAIETSCDDTSIAIVKDGKEVMTSIVSSQIAAHQPFGGVVPEIASRHHLENIAYVSETALAEAKMSFADVDAFAVTYGPGLVGSLLVGVSYAKALAYALNKPLLPVHHLEGHLYAGFLEKVDFSFPLLVLIVSGGHTTLLNMLDHGKYEVIGITRDDAAGEAFDKISRVLGLGYPGGPFIQKLAEEGNPTAIKFPRAWLEKGSYDFSFSGLKSSVINFLHNAKQKGESIDTSDIAASFQEALVEVLVTKTIQGAQEYNVKNILVAGGVAANAVLRSKMQRSAEEHNIQCHFPSPKYCTDNAAMIACAAYYTSQFKERNTGMDLNAIPYQSLPNRIQ